MARAGDIIHQVSGSGETARRFFATREAAERYLRDEVGATFDEKIGWHSQDGAGNIQEYFSIEELVLG